MREQAEGQIKRDQEFPAPASPLPGPWVHLSAPASADGIGPWWQPGPAEGHRQGAGWGPATAFPLHQGAGSSSDRSVALDEPMHSPAAAP